MVRCDLWGTLCSSIKGLKVNYPDWMTETDIEQFDLEMSQITIQEEELDINKILAFIWWDLESNYVR